MPRELEQPMRTVSPDAAISALLCLLHSYAQAGQPPSSRIGQRISLHLEGLAQRDDLPEVLQKTCEDLSDAWHQFSAQQGRP